MIAVDRNTVIQVLGSLMNKPELLSDTDKYLLEPTDFSQQLDRFVFSAIYNLYVGGAEKIHTVDIDNYLSSNVLAKELIEKENGLQFLQDCEEYGDYSNFSYYYNKLKKINLLRDLSKNNYDVSDFYCEDPLSDDYYTINEKFENMTINDILNKIKGTYVNLENKYAFNTVVEESNPVDDIEELIEELKIKPEVGVKLQGEIYNTIVRGGRKKTLYLRSAGSGVGKSRQAVGDACYIAYPIRYESKYGRWISTGQTEKVLYVMTEQDKKEIQTMILAYLTDINEEYFKFGNFLPEHESRIKKAIEIMKRYKDNLLFARIPEPTPSIIKNLFRRYNLQYGVSNFFFDYIFSNEAMLAEYRDLKLPEHVCLRLFTTALKNLAIELDSFICTSTQISEQENDKKSSWKDYHNIAGARAIVHLVDVGCITSRPTVEELKLLEGFIQTYGVTPNFVTDFFKNRGGRWVMVRVWSVHDLGTCRKHDLFITTPDLRPIENFQVVDFIQEKTEEMYALEKEFNDGQDDNGNNDDLLTILTENPLNNTELENKIEQAFGNIHEHKARIVDKSFEDLL